MPYKDIEQKRAYQRQWIAKRREDWISENGPCVDCGSTDDLEVDHVSGEKVTHRVWSWSTKRMLEELAKCVVRCKPCHRRSTTRREQFTGAVFTYSEATEIREKYASGRYTQTQLAHEYGVQQQAISKVVTWRHWNVEVP